MHQISDDFIHVETIGQVNSLCSFSGPMFTVYTLYMCKVIVLFLMIGLQGPILSKISGNPDGLPR